MAEVTRSVRTAAQEPTGAAALRGAARHGVANLAGVAVAAAAGFALNIVVTRGWSVRDAGLFFAGTSAFMIAYAVSRLGTGVGSVYFVSRARALGQPERIRPAVLAGAVPVALTGTALGVAGWVSAPALAGVLFRDPTPDAVPMLRSLALFLPVAALGEMALSACRGFGRMGPLLLVDRLGRHGLQLVAVALAAVLGASVATGLPLAWALPYLPATVVALGWLAVLVRRAERAAAGTAGAAGGTRPRRVRLAREYWRYTGPRALGSLAQMTVQRLDIVLLAALRGAAEAAVYTAATRFLVLGQLSAQALATAVQHRIAEQMARGDRAAVSRLYQAATGWLVLLAWPAYLLFAVFAEAVLALFGSGYGSGRTVTVVLALTMLLATGCGMVDSVLNMAGKTSWTFYNALAAVAVNVTGDLLLIPPYGMLGAAAA
ncbi:MAG TPA: lipopolysaccharide biosynthesis protein, partial [Micromonosporaceae bacterium]|nr:lipopolysaccharide biosynthesis protein [Micromonosporaceae bacterium]